MRVALTFDVEHPDRPSVPGITERLVEILDREGTSASMFIQGRWAEANPDLTRSMGQAGHLIGNHSHYHARMPLFTDDGFEADVRAAEDAIREAGGVDPRPWFRCPFGTGQAEPSLRQRLEALGYRAVGWHVDAKDWDLGDAPALERDVIDGALAHGDGTVVLLHGWPRRTAEALPGIIRGLRDAGAEFVTVDTLPDLPLDPPWADGT